MHTAVAEITAGLVERFWSYVDIRGENECWPWTKSTDGSKYARFCLPNKIRVRCSHIAIFLTQGPPPEGKPFVLHTCDNLMCCNPVHFFYGTQIDNMQDCAKKGRNAVQKDPSIVRGERNGKTKLTHEQVVSIRASDLPQTELARLHKVTKHAIWRIKHNINWRHAT
jgi:hypothetical protein